MSRRRAGGRGRPGATHSGGRRSQREARAARAGGGVSPDLLDDTAAGRRVSFRTALLAGALVLVAGGLIQPVGTGLQQMQQIAALEADIDATRGEVDQLQEERERLDDPVELERMAREDLQYVQDGKEAYIVVDGSADRGDDADASPASSAQVVRAQPWYIELADSLRAVGYASEERTR